MRPSLPRRDPRTATPPKNRRVVDVKPRVAATPQRKAPARLAASVARPNRRLGGPVAVRTTAATTARRPRKSLIAALRNLPRPQIGPRTRRLIGAGVRLGLALVLAWGVLLGVQQGYQYVTTSAHFEARTIAFEPTTHVSPVRLRELMGIGEGTNILAVDVDAMRQQIEADPWVASATVQRELPDTLRVAVVEHEPAAVLHAGHFYLLSRLGVPFKRALPGERRELPIITGVERDQLIANAPAATATVRRGLDVLAAWQEKARPRLGEIHIGDGGEAVLYSEKSGTMLRLGRGPVADKLERYDALRATLGTRADKLSVVHLDAAGPDGGQRVVVSFVDDADAAAVLAQNFKKPPADHPAAQLSQKPASPPPAAKPAKPSSRPSGPALAGKPAKNPKPGAHKFASGIPKYE